MGKVGRRAVLALAALPALGHRCASAASAPSESAEMARLQAEAARIQEIFDVQKELNSALPSLGDGLKPGAEVLEPRQLAGVRDVVDAVGSDALVRIRDDKRRIARRMPMPSSSKFIGPDVDGDGVCSMNDDDDSGIGYPPR